MPLNNSQYQKNANISLIAREIWLKGETSRAEVSQNLGLYRSTVTNIINYLLENGIAKEGVLLESGSAGGRKATSIKINPEFGAVVGIDIQPYLYHYVILGFDGHIIHEGKKIVGEMDFATMLDTATDAVLAKMSRSKIPVLVISYSFPGIIDTNSGTIQFSAPLNLTEPFPVRERMEKKYGITVLVENDANCLCSLDHHAGLIDDDSTVMVVMGEDHTEAKGEEIPQMGIGLGMGIMTYGKVYHGSHFASGEFVSMSWDMVKASQTGLDFETLTTTDSNELSWRLWMEDTFRSLIPVVAIMDLKKIIIHCPRESRIEKVRKFLLEDLEPFKRVLEKTGCSLEFGTCHRNKCALGAAIHYLESVFYVNEEQNDLGSQLTDWDELVAKCNV